MLREIGAMANTATVVDTSAVAFAASATSVGIKQGVWLAPFVFSLHLTHCYPSAVTLSLHGILQESERTTSNHVRLSEQYYFVEANTNLIQEQDYP